MRRNGFKRRLVQCAGAAFSVLILVGIGLGFLVLFPDTPLPRHWNPVEPLRVSDPVSPLTRWKLSRALATPETCIDTLRPVADFRRLQDFEATPHCHIRPQVALSSVGAVRMREVNTRCQTALRMTMWIRHGVQPAARKHLDTSVTGIRHISSYSCREIRTGNGPSGRMSTHATADAIDIAGFVLADDRSVDLLEDWTGDTPRAAFLRAARDSACTWFRVTLGPDYNSLHADHFHLQNTGWGLCR